MLQSFSAVLATLALLAFISLLANQRFRDVDRLPMKIQLDGSPGWTAPRALALSLTPILAVFVLLPAAALLGNIGLGPLPVLVLSLSFIAMHLLHIGLIAKSLKV
ncbi:hypothetical protein GCM10010909_04670 [Acidocella aquatica]|uniref:DUF1648 domain-containing protein n=1 Tax=Acidocella aquatica TaxID=1922313 RepID=A0ABQ6A6P0_9PROT|nr:hypothetical protein [Acidocella aquatica]GLR65789.1 hypothetical protein GCM10010909_04670 [Acidocella aquatica]